MELPSEESLRWLVGRYARLQMSHGEGIGTPHLVQPTPADFPDVIDPSPQGVGRFMARMLHYAPVAGDLDVRVRLVTNENATATGGGCGTGGCGSGACATPGEVSLGDRVVELDDAYLLELPWDDIIHPTKLAAALARCVGTVVLLEAGEEIEDHELGGMSELAAAACGFGVLLTGGSHIFGKSCGGVSVRRHTHLSLEEHAVLLALFTRLHGCKPRHARAELEATQREALDEAIAWVDSNPSLVADLRDRPEVLSDGVFKVAPTKGFFGRLFGGSAPREDAAAAAPARPPRQRSAEEQARLEEARALVEGALTEPGSRSG